MNEKEIRIIERILEVIQSNIDLIKVISERVDLLETRLHGIIK